MSWLVTGAAGLLGQDVVALLRSEGERVAALGRHDLDITDRGQVAEVFAALNPSVVVNCAAWTAVDDAEKHEEAAHRVNAEGPRLLAEACRTHGSRLVQVSTDYVFPGDDAHPYGESAPTGPRTAYGRTKLAGERAVLELLPHASVVVRTAWLYGAHGPNFVRTMCRLAAEREWIEVVDDQRGQPTWSADVAARLVALGRRTATTGIFHATNSGSATWYDLARAVFELLGNDPDRVRPTTSAAHPRPAPRPAYSVLGHARWAAAAMAAPREWHSALRAAFPATAGAVGP